MPERPLILFPIPEDSDKAKRPHGAARFSKPTVGRQFERLEPKFTQLQQAFDQRRMAVQQSPIGIEPELALVFETVGSVDNFYTAIKHVPDIEWMFDLPLDQIVPDDDFFIVDDEGQRKDGHLTGKIYCVMTNKRAIDELISLWTQYKENPEFKFARGFSGLRDVFLHLRDVRYWSARDRIEETGILTYWKESLELQGTDEVNFEIELFFRRVVTQRQSASQGIRDGISALGGHFLTECIIEDISYHCILASLPRNQVQELVNNYEGIALVKVDDIMFFRPVGQTIYRPLEESYELDEQVAEAEVGDTPPVAAILDGYPMQNHSLLSNRLIIDDPDDWGNGYQVKDRIHGTAIASLVIYGDYSAGNTPLTRKIYFRPIYKPVTYVEVTNEVVPKNVILVDLIHRAIKRIFEGEGNSPAVAPTVRLINLSLGDPARCFINMMSPLARLLDWLSFKYKVLLVISAGNHNLDGIDCGIEFSQFKQLTHQEREKAILKYVEDNSRKFRLLSPAESINGLTIGSLFSDRTSAEENDHLVLPYHKPLPSPISAIGLGYNRSIKPDIFYSGGRKFLTDSVIGTTLKWAGTGGPTSRSPGCLVAVPGTNQDRSYKAFIFGTSAAAAQVSHEGVRCFDVLDDIFLTQTGSSVPMDHSALLIKAMLVHGARWGDNATSLVDALQLSGRETSRIYRWIGNGNPDISRVEECAKNRITLIGYGSLSKDKAHVYQFPLPFDFSTERIFRRLVVTLSYFSPIAAKIQKYRSAFLWFSLENNTLFTSRENSDWQSVRRGTLQHEIFYGDQARAWDSEDSIKIKINCVEDAEKLSAQIPYAVLVTFELAEGLDIDVYSRVATRIREMIPITPSAS